MCTKKELIEIKKQKKELLELILKKTGTKKKDVIDWALEDFIVNNINLVSASEKKKFDKLVFYAK